MADNDKFDYGTNMGIYNPILCAERMSRLKSDIDNGLITLRAEVKTCQDSMLSKIESEKNLALAKDEGRQKSISEALIRIEEGQNALDAKIDRIDNELPDDCIKRLSALEGWKKYIVGSFATSSLFAYLLWKYVEHILTEHAHVIEVAQKIIEQHGGK